MRREKIIYKLRKLNHIFAEYTNLIMGSACLLLIIVIFAGIWRIPTDKMRNAAQTYEIFQKLDVIKGHTADIKEDIRLMKEAVVEAAQVEMRERMGRRNLL